MKIQSRMPLLAVATLLGVGMQACSSDSATPELLPTGVSAVTGTTGVTFKATKTATAFLRESSTYDWEIAKTVTPSALVLARGESGEFDFVVTATRSQVESSRTYGMSGQVCATNTGTESTSGLLISDRVFQLVNGVFTEVGAFLVDVSANPELDPGESHCYGYSLEMAPGFVPNPAAEYRNVAYLHTTFVTEEGITQLIRVSQPTVTFAWPTEPTETATTDASADVADLVDCPTGFTCTPETGDWTFNGTTAQPVTVVVNNVSAVCGSQFLVRNSASLTEVDTETSRGPATASGTVTTPSCTPPPSIHGCTPGYWKQKQHFDSWVGYTQGQDYDAVFGVNAFTPNRTLLQALSSGGGQMNRLGRHSAAALLNTANSGVQYGMTTDEVITLVKQAVASGNYDFAADRLEKLNERGCPLN